MSTSETFAEKVADRIVEKGKSSTPNPDSVRRKNLNPNISSPMELQSSVLTPQTGRAKIGDGLDNVYKVKFTDSDTGEESKVDVWDLFSSVTSDTRISNLDPNKPEYAFVQWGMDMWIKCMQNGYMGSTACAQGMVLATTEPSLAKGMAFLKNIQTVRQESQHIQVEENKKSRNLFGLLKKE